MEHCVHGHKPGSPRRGGVQVKVVIRYFDEQVTELENLTTAAVDKTGRNLLVYRDKGERGSVLTEVLPLAQVRAVEFK